MRLSIIAIGRLKDGPERDLCARYQERATALSRSLGFTGPDIVELAESRGRRSEERRNEEARLIAERLPQGLVIALDERGKNLGSEAFAGKIAAARDAGTPAATLLIGGADGLAEELRARAGLVLCFGALTIPHQIVRALALEQLYRAMTIMAGHPYHRA
ncbi:23S rRNA (pseudouridine(1915)-N(3))-methyltransferase RlmH [Bosea rubneri]|uniref:Ribosomal RNA large subunit methyltransferase H n=1 Tax=Bosea rubneri TaxID=3075434 RepID=A0ABU3S7B1_9HYPH|nr:23S rRNA (pseudouridine(1915)-N(3))-methyltransferase RlmH [Bosea sp. ZW T0_25]MDU0340687.1 23S rRNA (pseudouridine(1915)-N(3))-methyltransferase RlmH [Bosea sp. ZW T0_25]